MNTIKKISTLFALALISQSSFASETTTGTDTTTTTGTDTTTTTGTDTTTTPGTDTTTTDIYNEAIILDVPANVAYTPTNSQIDAAGDIRSAMQNTLQSASVDNSSDLANQMQLSDVYGIDIMNGMTSSANAMNSNTGSSYNDSTNTINTTSTDSSTNTVTSTLNESTNFTPDLTQTVV